MATGYISEAVPELGGLYKFGICYGRDKTYDRVYCSIDERLSEV